MRSMASAAVRAFSDRIGWNRLGVALCVAVMAAAFAILYRIVEDVDIAHLLAAVDATPIEQVLIASGFVLFGYFSLTFYDLFSLRTIGRADVPYRVAALASFTSYAIGHNLGATAFTGGTIRFRIYSAWGLTVVDVAKIAFVTGLTFWLGNAFMLGFGMAWQPKAASAIDQLPASANQAIGLATLAIIVGYVAWIAAKPRVVGRNDWQVALPNIRFTMVQIGIGVLDLGSSALAMYALLPAHPEMDFVSLLVMFVMATLLGFLSHAPGSFGVFDLAMLIALGQFDKEQLLASLLLFRLLYFIVPFALALVVLGCRELLIATKRARGRQAGD
jgi:glycosyltransferase 2 family protein